MRKLIFAAVSVALAGSALAGPANNPKLQAYLEQTLTLCPGAQTVLQTVDVQGPKHFDAYRISMTSSLENCRDRTYAIHSPSTGQVIWGQIIPLEPSSATTAEKIQDLLETRMNLDGESKILEEDLPDGVKRVEITKNSPSGDVTLYGYLDESEQFFILGRRGNLSEDPKTTLFDSLDVESAAARGPEDARIEIVELSDFQCPACARAHEILEPYVQKYGEQIRYMRLDLPITDHHPWAMKAALGARAIQQVAPRHYWSYVDYIFENQPNITAESIDQVVQDFVEGTGIDRKSFQRHYESPSERSRLNRQTGRAFENSIFATPTILVDGRPLFYGENGSGLEAYLKQLFGE